MLGRHVCGELHAIEVGNLDDRLLRGAIHLLAAAHHALHDLA